jgi:hypothetical protein
LFNIYFSSFLHFFSSSLLSILRYFLYLFFLSFCPFIFAFSPSLYHHLSSFSCSFLSFLPSFILSLFLHLFFILFPLSSYIFPSVYPHFSRCRNGWICGDPGPPVVIGYVRGCRAHASDLN